MEIGGSVDNVRGGANGMDQLAVMPASTGSTAPVTAVLSALHTHASNAAISRGSMSRPSGW
jgi:hypothetical protein